MNKCNFAEYIWLDGAEPTRQLRSKSRNIILNENPKIKDFPEWGFDGSSTNQASGDNSDCTLKPVNFVKDSTRDINDYLVLCEVFNADGTPHKSNSRAQLRKILNIGAIEQDPWIGFEQEYTLFKHRNPLGWPESGFPGSQGPYYCGVGSRKVFGRNIAEEHAKACNDSGLIFYGVNAEVMPGQWEFQIGFRGEEKEKVDVMNISDHLWLARWLLHKLSEKYGLHVSFKNKPVKGDWNGAGMHTNFSTKNTRNKKNGMSAINKAIKILSTKHKEHILLYGNNLEERLTGLHETCDINTFKYGVADRGSSIRIPQNVNINGYGYFEDRRPGANADPYLVSSRLCTSVCEIDENMMEFTSWPRN